MSVTWAETPEPPGTKVANAERTSDLNKEVGLVDLYLTEAINGAKFLATIADAAPGANDKAILLEARKDLDAAIDMTLVHTGKLRARKSDLALAADRGGPVASAPAPAKSPASIDELERQLKNARIAGRKLAVTRLSELSGAIDGVATHLMGADNAFRGIAKWTNYTRLSSTNLATVPVRGDELPPSGGTSRDLDRGGVTPSPGPRDAAPPGVRSTGPGMTTPGAAPPGNPDPAASEPVQPAPGATSPATGQPAK